MMSGLNNPSVKRALFRGESDEKCCDNLEEITPEDGSVLCERDKSVSEGAPQDDPFWEQMERVLSLRKESLTESCEAEKYGCDEENDLGSCAAACQKEASFESSQESSNSPDMSTPIKELRIALEKLLNLDQTFPGRDAGAGTPATTDTSIVEDSSFSDTANGDFPGNNADSRKIANFMEYVSYSKAVESLKERLCDVREVYKHLSDQECADFLAVEELKKSVKRLKSEQMKWLKEEQIQSMKLEELKEKSRKIRMERVKWIEGMKKNVRQLQAQRKWLLAEEKMELQRIEASKRSLMDVRGTMGTDSRRNVSTVADMPTCKPGRSRSFGDEKSAPPLARRKLNF